MKLKEVLGYVTSGAVFAFIILGAPLCPNISLCGSGTSADYENPVAGTVTYANGVTPIAGAFVTLVPRQGERLVVMSGNTGAFLFDHPPDGLHRFVGKKGAFSGEVEVDVREGKIENPITLPLDASEGGFAVVEGEEDNIETLIEGLGYAYSNLNDQDLKDESNLEGYQLLFLTSGSDTSWADDAQVQNNLKSFVSDGGYLYVSDQNYVYVQNCWPNKVIFVKPDAAIGEIQTLTADVVDAEGTPSLGGYLGKNTAEIGYSYGNWAVLDSKGTDTTALLKGDPETTEGQLTDKPLLVYFEYGEGIVVYTSFGYHDSVTEDMLHTLEYIVSLQTDE